MSPAAERREEPATLGDEHVTTLHAIATWQKDAPAGIVERAMMGEGDFEAWLAENADADANWRGGLGRVLNELVSWGYLERLKASELARDRRPGYRLTAKGAARVKGGAA